METTSQLQPATSYVGKFFRTPIIHCFLAGYAVSRLAYTSEAHSGLGEVVADRIK